MLRAKLNGESHKFSPTMSMSDASLIHHYSQYRQLSGSSIIFLMKGMNLLSHNG